MRALLSSAYRPCRRLSKQECPGNDLEVHRCMRRYKFVVTMENTPVRGYVTEKVVNGALSGGVPICETTCPCARRLSYHLWITHLIPSSAQTTVRPTCIGTSTPSASSVAG